MIAACAGPVFWFWSWPSAGLAAGRPPPWSTALRSLPAPW